MARKDKKSKPTGGAAKAEAPAKADAKKRARSKDGTRDTIESIVVAFIFAFLVRTFEAEAFVIPTGSMAETLFGRHKDIDCPQCGLQFEIGASEEFSPHHEGILDPDRRIRSAVCPNCRYAIDAFENPAFRGDRIIVNKFPYDIGEPDRWDVVVFKYPEDPETNYIKRLVGLPGETLEIKQGDLYRISKDGRYEILRKESAAKQAAMRFLVHDNDLPSEALREIDYPERWIAAAKDDAPGNVAGWSVDASGWESDEAERSFSITADDGDSPKWVRYRHIPPSREDWNAIEDGLPPDPRASLIVDVCGYNSWSPIENGISVDNAKYWVGDLAISAEVRIDRINEGGTLLFELVEGQRRYRCRIEPSTGLASLSYLDGLSVGDSADDEVPLAQADTWLRGTGTYDVVFSNADDQLGLTINGSPVNFGKAAAYEPYGALDIQLPTQDDLIPIGIAATGLDVTVRHLRVERDIYYQSDHLDPLTQYNKQFGKPLEEATISAAYLRELATDPERWGRAYLDNLLVLEESIDPSVYQYELGPDEFMMLGDNSQRSKDSRLWSNSRLATHRHAVHRSALVGKAFFFLWPHGIPVGNPTEQGVPQGYAIPGLESFCYHKYVDRNGQIRLNTDYHQFGVPFYPNFERIFRPIR